MNLWPVRNRVEKQRLLADQEDKVQLLQEIKKAHLEWVTAQMHFDFVCDREQIDYAVYALEAAEKRYEMLIRQAKRLNYSQHEVLNGSLKEVKGS